MTLRDQPNEIVFTALRPKDRPPERSGPMGLGQLPALPGQGMDPSLSWEDPMTSGQATVQNMLAASMPQEPQQQPPTIDVQPQQAQPAPQPQAAPQPAPQASAQPSEEELMQQLLVSG